MNKIFCIFFLCYSFTTFSMFKSVDKQMANLSINITTYTEINTNNTIDAERIKKYPIYNAICINCIIHTAHSIDITTMPGLAYAKTGTTSLITGH